MKHRCLSCLIVIAMLMSIVLNFPLGSSIVIAEESFNPVLYKADLYVKEGEIPNNALKDYQDWISPGVDFANIMSEKPGFSALIAEWQAATFEPEMVSGMYVDEIGYYETLIFNSLYDYQKSSFIKETFDNDYVKNGIGMWNTFTGILKADSSTVEADIIGKSFVDLTEKDQAKTMEYISDAFNQAYPNISNKKGFTDKLSDVLKVREIGEETFKNLSAYMACYDMTESIKAVVSDLYAKCDGTTNPCLKQALQNVNNACQSYSLAWSSAINDAGMRSFSYAFGKVTNEMYDAVLTSQPFGLGIKIGQQITKPFVNILFSTDEICEQYYKLSCLKKYEQLLQETLKTEIQDYKNERNETNAQVLFAAVEILFNSYHNSCDMAEEYNKLVFAKGVAGLFEWNKESYEHYSKEIVDIKSALRTVYSLNIVTQWQYKLQYDHPEFYEEYNNNLKTVANDNESATENPTNNPNSNDSLLMGDVNGDSEVSVVDIVMLQRWLLNDGTKLKNSKAADINKDGAIDVFDLGLLKRDVINSALKDVDAKHIFLSNSGSPSTYITSNNELYMWGWNANGEFGNGKNENSATPLLIMNDVIDGAFINANSAAITKDHSLYMWGSNYNGQIGDGTKVDRKKPVKVLDNVRHVEMINEFGAFTAAITDDDCLYMWGGESYYNNNHGILGNGSTNVNSATPLKVLEDVRCIALGEIGECAAILNNGDLYVWGYNEYGQLGTGDKKDVLTPKKIMDHVRSVQFHDGRDIMAIDESGNLFIANDSKMTKILENVRSVHSFRDSGGMSHSAAITNDNGLYTWGDNYYGQLGDGKWDDRYLPERVMNDVKSVALGHGTTAIITVDNTLFMCGEKCALGEDYQYDRVSYPTQVMENVVEAAVGYTACAAITKDGNLYMWGSCRDGQLGNGIDEEYKQVYTPTKVSVP